MKVPRTQQYVPISLVYKCSCSTLGWTQHSINHGIPSNTEPSQERHPTKRFFLYVNTYRVTPLTSHHHDINDEPNNPSQLKAQQRVPFHLVDPRTHDTLTCAWTRNPIIHVVMTGTRSSRVPMVQKGIIVLVCPTTNLGVRHQTNAPVVTAQVPQTPQTSSAT
jgi:hypothetical protein